MCFILKNFFAQSGLGFAHPAYATLQRTVIYKTPLHRVRTHLTKQISRTRNDFSRALKFTLMLLHYLDLNVNSPYCLPYTSFFYKIIWFYALVWQWELATVKRFKSWCFKHLVELTDFINFPQPVAFFPQLSSPAKYHNIIPGLSRFSRTHTNLAGRYPSKTSPQLVVF